MIIMYIAGFIIAAGLLMLGAHEADKNLKARARIRRRLAEVKAR